MIHLGGFLVASVVVLLYNVGIEKYGNHRMDQMAQIPALEFDERDDLCAMSTADLRRTVSSRSGLVENLDDRRAWNKWLLSTADSKNSKKDGYMYVAPGKYYFKYRSYVNFEESGAIKKALLHIPTWLGFVAERTGEMKVYPDGRRVTITDFFLKGLVTPITITWEGTLTKQRGKPTIVWTGTSMTTGRGKGKKTIPNPPMSEQLRKIPWQIIKVEDGIVGFRRGDVGLLAYAAEQ